MSESAVRERERDTSSRKRFLSSLGGAGAVGALGLLLGACGDEEEPRGPVPGGPREPERSRKGGNDLEIVNFALTLEYLEADLYEQALDSGLLTGELHDLAREFGQTERKHARTLKRVAARLGEPVDAPRTDFSQALSGQQALVSALATVENVGAAAYLGAAPAIQDRELLATALSIHSVEGRHAAALNELIGVSFVGDAALMGSIPDGAFAAPMTMDEVRNRIEPFLVS